MLRWSSVAPLETPVVPPVYCRKATSPGDSLGLLKDMPRPADSASLKDTARGRDRILQHVRHHDRDASAALEPTALQIGSKRHRHLVEVAIADRLVHADERLAVGELGEALLQQVDQRCVLGWLDVSGHAGRI